MNFEEIKTVLILQPENPDGDSVASALALEEILGDQGKAVTIYSYVHIPDYLGYIQGADRITEEFPNNFDLTIIVDTVTASLLENTLKGARLAAISKKPVLVLDHHPTENNLPLENAEFYGGEGECVATGEIVYHLARKNGWDINAQAATHIVESMLADTLGLTTEAVNGPNVAVVAQCLDLGAKMSEIDKRRREYMKKSQKIVTYKGVLLQRVEYLCNKKLGFIHIPWEETQQYSPFYNPAMLVIEELRNTEDIELSVAIKTYPDGKITGKIRANNLPLAGELAAHFGGGGHVYAAGFKTTEWNYEELKNELIKKASSLLQ
jgi:phosphoesterase RecJ-like protein